MKILVVNDLLQGGGVEKLMYDIVMQFHDKYEITILTDKMDRDFGSLYPENVKYIYQMEKAYPFFKNRIKRKLIHYKKKYNEWKLKRRIARIKFDVMLCMKEGWIMLMALTYGETIPCRISWNHTDYSKSYYTKDWFRTAENEIKCMQKFHHIVCVSQVIMDSIKSVIGDPQNLMVLYNPLDKIEILHKGSEPVVDISRHECPLFVTVGRLNRQKGYDILLEVCNLLNAEGYVYDVWIIGGGEGWNNYEVLHDLEDKIYRYNLKNVYLLGSKANPYKYMKQGDWFLSTSRYEGYSYVSQEAALLGKALMLTSCSGVMELLGCNDNGVVLENSFKGIYLGMREAIIDAGRFHLYEKKVPIKDAQYYKEERMNAIEQLWRV